MNDFFSTQTPRTQSDNDTHLFPYLFPAVFLRHNVTYNALLFRHSNKIVHIR